MVKPTELPIGPDLSGDSRPIEAQAEPKGPGQGQSERINPGCEMTPGLWGPWASAYPPWVGLCGPPFDGGQLEGPRVHGL
jgi:hypothetical protein